MHPVRPGVLGSGWVLEGEEGREGSDRGGCWGSVMSVAVRSLLVDAGEEGVGETECVVSEGSVGGVVVGCRGVVVLGGSEGLRSSIHCRICWATDRLMEGNIRSSWSLSTAVMSSQR